MWSNFNVEKKIQEKVKDKYFFQKVKKKEIKKIFGISQISLNKKKLFQNFPVEDLK
jgi:hypothetical protein